MYRQGTGMVKPAHTRMTWSGVVGSASAPIERWSFSINSMILIDDAIADAAFTTMGDRLYTAWETGFKTCLAADVRLTETRLASILSTGKTARRADGSYLQKVQGRDSIGTGGVANYLPLQTAVAVSLRTTRADATGKGRFFLPTPGYTPLTTDKRLTEGSANQILTSCKTALEYLAANALDPWVVSSLGYATKVNGIRVGRVLDTMRSRREDLVEGYVSTDIVDA